MEKLPEDDVMIEERNRLDQEMEEEEEEDVMMMIEKPKKLIGRPVPTEEKFPEEEEDVMMNENIFLNLPEDVMIEKILLNLPGKSLSNLRYVSKYLRSLITNPSFVKLHLHHSSAQINNHLLLISSHRRSICMYKDGSLGPNHINHNYACKFFTTSSSSSSPEVEIVEEMACPFETTTEIRASCNGLLYLHRRVVDAYDGDVDILNYIWNPCTKEYKELPPPPSPLILPLLEDDVNYDLTDTSRFSSSTGICGFGYDRTNDKYKILHYENLVDPTYIVRGFFRQVTHVSSTVEFNLYTLGGKNNTWTRIVDNPYKSFFFKESRRRIGLLVNGALHWIMCLSDPNYSKGKIVSFDFGKEVFREVQKPHYYFREEEEEAEVLDQQHCHESLQVLQECLCICMYHHQVHPDNKDVCKIDIWMLRDYDAPDSWTKLFRVVMPSIDFSHRHFTLLRYFENNGEILMVRNHKDMIMYDPLNHKARRATKFNESIAGVWLYYMDYTESLVSLNSGTYTSS